MKQTFSILALAGALLVGGSSAAMAGNTSDKNHPDYWAPVAGDDSRCYKTEAHGTRSQDGQSFRLSAFDPRWYGDGYTLLVLKGGSKYNPGAADPYRVVVHDPQAGQWYGGAQEISHVIVCKGKVPPPPPEFDPRANVRVCGDPRAIIALNNRRSDVSTTYEITFRHGGTFRSKTFTKTVAAGARNLLAPRWVKGNSRLTIVATARTFGLASEMSDTVVYDRKLPNAKPWGKASCPDSLRHAKRLARQY